MKSKPVKVGLRTTKTVLSVFLCFLIDSFRSTSVPFHAVIASILCIQPDMENSLSVAENRELSTIIGGMLGMLFLFMEKISTYSARNTSGTDLIYFVDSNHQSVCTIETEKRNIFNVRCILMRNSNT